MRNFLLLFLFVSVNSYTAVSSRGESKQEGNPYIAETNTSSPPLQTNRKVSGIFDDVLEGLKKTIEDAERLDELTGESGRIHVMIRGLEDYLDDYNQDVLYDRVTGILLRSGNYEMIDLGEIAEGVKFRKTGSTGPNPKERARALSLSDLGVLEMNVIYRMHNGYSRGSGILKMTTKATVQFTLFQAALGHIIWQKRVSKTVYDEIETGRENYNRNMHGVTLKDTNMRTLMLTALEEVLPELPKKYH